MFPLQSETEMHMRKLHGFDTWSGLLFFTFYRGQSWEAIHERDHDRIPLLLEHFHHSGEVVLTRFSDE